MLQQVMTKPGEIIFREVEIPEVKDDQVLVKIMNIGYLRIGYPCISWKASFYKISCDTGT